jgi:hypothetical protein
LTEGLGITSRRGSIAWVSVDDEQCGASFGA